MVRSNRTDMRRFGLGSQLRLLEMVLLRHGRRWIGMDICDLFSQLNYLSFHLRIPTSFADSFEVGFNFTIKFQPTTP